MSKREPNPRPPHRLRKAGGLLLAALAVVGLMHLLPAVPAAADSPAARSHAGWAGDGVRPVRGAARELLDGLARRQAAHHQDRLGHRRH
jgi:hypothetical protein